MCYNNFTMKGSEIFIKALENEGVKYIFGVPGEENLDLLESIRQSKQIEMIVTRHEQSAGFMAATIGRLTGNPGVCLSTLGPGATNLFTAAAYAQLGAMPMFMITGQKPIKSSKQGRFQIIDVVGMMNPVTKYSSTMINANRISPAIREAFRRAKEERPGATHIELPEDIADEKIDDIQLFPSEKVRRPIAEDKAINKLKELVLSAKSPLISIGAGANRKMTSKMLTEFIELTKIPFFSTQMGKGVVDERLPSFLGCAALSSNDYLHCAIKKSDLIINIGHDVVEKPPFFMTEDGPTVVHVNFYGAEVDSVYFPQYEVIGDVGNTIWQLKEALEKDSSWKDKWDFGYFDEVREKFKKHIAEFSDDGEFPLKPQRIVADVRSVMPEDGIVTLDNGMYKLWFARYYPTYKPNTLLLDNALATMGAGLPSGIAAKMIYPDRKVIVVAGDGGFMMNSQELETAIRLKLDLVVLIVNDSGYGMIKWKQKGMEFEDYGLDYKNPDFVKYAESYGAVGHRVEKADDLKNMIEKAQSEGGVHIIDVPIDYSENQRVFDGELKNVIC